MVRCREKKSSAGRVVQISGLVWSERVWIRIDDMNAVHQKLENKSAIAIEDVLCAEKTNKRSQVKNPNN